MPEVVIVEAVRSAIGKRNGSLSQVHAVDLLAEVLKGLVAKAGISGADIGQVVGGCVTQVGRQGANVTRNAWLAAGLPLEVAATTVDAQCGSSQQATSLAYGLVASGQVDAAIGCGVETMSQFPIGASMVEGLGTPMESRLYGYQWTSQFHGSELIAQQWDISREDLEAWGAESQRRAAQAWAEDRFAGQIVEVNGLVRDEGLRETTAESLAGLRTVIGTDDPIVGPEGGRHTAGTASQVSDGAAAVLLMTAEKADQLGLVPIARIVDSCLVGSDPVLMLTGPIPATRHLLERNKLTIDDIDVVEINEAFASVVLSWQQETGADLAKVNPNGGAIALGHPLGGTGAFLLTKVVHELRRSGGRYGLVTMCCGGGMGTGTLVERV